MKIDKRDLLAATAPGALLALVLLAAAGKFLQGVGELLGGVGHGRYRM